MTIRKCYYLLFPIVLEVQCQEYAEALQLWPLCLLLVHLLHQSRVKLLNDSKYSNLFLRILHINNYFANFTENWLIIKNNIDKFNTVTTKIDKRYVLHVQSTIFSFFIVFMKCRMHFLCSQVINQTKTGKYQRFSCVFASL